MRLKTCADLSPNLLQKCGLSAVLVFSSAVFPNGNIFKALEIAHEKFTLFCLAIMGKVKCCT